ncbi:DUF4037 domain-containing protein [Actinoplanes sp. N902-109]|uniref:DUF4037 domain-containing protein n=1 Tax=Actinoplanes sp. (strain N902-109) TaxID=649831 RepID=UPI0003294652|nr:DUF4037 domain-containing protein [Actinoplanes sp. N902-109]AGL20348.1 hypothetical protein L083_6838 [Actinoplanes sp. N902-109]
MPAFTPGVRLCRLFYEEAVRPLLDRAFPGLPHAAARVGPGSDVLGFDTERSTDHDWGPRLELFLAAADVSRHGAELSALFSARLPVSFRGWPTNFEPAGARVRVMTPTSGPVAHRIDITDVATWSVAVLGFDATREPGPAEWLTTPSQRFAEATGGAVFHDDSGELTRLRSRLRWYPDDVWRALLAGQWSRIAEEESFVGRTAEAGDELGSRVIAARLVHELMRLELLLTRRYPPYSKWLGTAVGPAPGLLRVLDARDASERQAALCTAYEAAARLQNATGLAEPVDPVCRPFFDRPFRVLDAGRFAAALRAVG